MDSVNYAQRIQNAILPKIQNIKDVFNQCFVVYQPKDIVAGDFYWYSDTPNEENQLNTYLISVADCTGHGVPGAFMTLIGSSLLNQIVNEDNVYNPSIILDELNRRLLKTLQQQNRNEQVNDGMDIALLSIDKSKKQITFSSAKRPLIYFQQGQFKEISSNRYPIGGAELKHKEFKDVVVPYQSGDTFYLYTDGFTDQFGGENDKKFNIRRFRELLTSIQNRTLQIQKEILENEFYLWKGSKDQTDDVLVIGIRMD
jgi:serine phosphatase RsbU (regulator of sigma subunit)